MWVQVIVRVSPAAFGAGDASSARDAVFAAVDVASVAMASVTMTTSVMFDADVASPAA